MLVELLHDIQIVDAERNLAKTRTAVRSSLVVDDAMISLSSPGISVAYGFRLLPDGFFLLARHDQDTSFQGWPSSMVDLAQ